uniref:Uncharacterized protein n=1 Tax=Anguilla anguilla TaxID=7936 RepID=A0A0E9R8F9_ANGAN
MPFKLCARDVTYGLTTSLCTDSTVSLTWTQRVGHCSTKLSQYFHL